MQIKYCGSDDLSLEDARKFMDCEQHPQMADIDSVQACKMHSQCCKIKHLQMVKLSASLLIACWRDCRQLGRGHTTPWTMACWCP